MRFGLNLAQLLSRWYLPATLIVLLLTLASGYALWDPGLNADFSLRTLVGRNNEEFRQLEQFVDDFAGVELALIVIESPAVLSPSTQACMTEIVTRAEQLPAVASAASLSKIPWLLRTMVAKSDLARGLLISADGKVAAIVLQMQDDASAGVARRETVASLKSIVSEALLSHPDHQVVLTGPYVLSYEMANLVWADLKTFGVLGVMATMLTLSVALGSWRLSAYPLAVGGATVLLTLGLSIWWQINTALNLPMLILLVAVLTMANCIHLAARHGEGNRPEALTTVKQLLWPCFGVVATTIAGFAAVGISDLQPVRTFALLMSAGLAIGLLLSLLGAFVALSAPPRPALLARPIEGLLNASLGIALRWPRWISASFLIITIAAIGLTSNLQFSLRFLENFREGDPLRSAYEFVETKLTPMQSIEILVRRSDGASPVTPEVVAAAAKITSAFRQHEAISRTLSLVDVLTFAGGKLPTSQSELDRQLLAVETTLKVSMGEKPLALFISDDRSTFRISFLAHEGPSAKEKISLAEEIANQARRDLGDPYQVEVTGLYYFYAHLTESLLNDQVATLATSGLGVFLTLAYVLGSWRLAFVGMAPGVLAAASCVGLMVLFNVPLNMVTSMMLAIALGIAIDGTVHYLWHYRSLRATGAITSEAITRAHLTVGQACTFTSMVVAAGFAVMGFSRFLPIAYFGGVTSVVILVALAANLLLLPALLAISRR